MDGTRFTPTTRRSNKRAPSVSIRLLFSPKTNTDLSSISVTPTRAYVYFVLRTCLALRVRFLLRGSRSPDTCNLVPYHAGRIVNAPRIRRRQVARFAGPTGGRRSVKIESIAPISAGHVRCWHYKEIRPRTVREKRRRR